MQIKKKFINDKILDAGREEYLAKGFRNANISLIAQNAGVPAGNLYRYFDGKNGLLDAIVKNVYTQVPRIIEKIAQDGSLDEMSETLCVFLEQYGKEVLILSDKCASTRYEEFTQNITLTVSKLLLEKLFSDTSEENEMFCNLLAKAFVGSIIELLAQMPSPQTLRATIKRLFVFYFFNASERL